VATSAWPLGAAAVDGAFGFHALDNASIHAKSNEKAKSSANKKTMRRKQKLVVFQFQKICAWRSGACLCQA
jgi:nitrate reductase NapE component